MKTPTNFKCMGAGPRSSHIALLLILIGSAPGCDARESVDAGDRESRKAQWTTAGSESETEGETTTGAATGADTRADTGAEAGTEADTRAESGSTSAGTTGRETTTESGTSGPETGVDTRAETGTETEADTGTRCVTDSRPPSGPDLGAAASFAVLGAASVTNVGATLLVGDLGVSPGTELMGFPPGLVIGTIHSDDAIASQAQTDLTAAYVDAANRPGAILLPADVSGMTLAPGVYTARTSLQIASADLTLDGGGDPNATWIFQIGTTLVTSSGADVILSAEGCGSAANVFWEVGSSATIGVGTDFVGTVMADQSITAMTGVTVDGRLLARIGTVTLDFNAVTVP